MDDHVSRILKMLEEGTISAQDAEKLISALGKGPAPGAAGPSASAGGTQQQTASRPADQRAESTTGQQDSGRAKSFEFQWSQRKGFAPDLSGLGKQISDAVKKLDIDKFVREARTGLAKGGRRFNEKFRGFTWFGDSDDGRPENTLGLPTARTSDTESFSVSADGAAFVDNPWGSISVFGGGEGITLEYDKEAWATTEEEARARLELIHVEAGVHADGGQPRLEVRVVAPDEWREGTVNVRLHVPEQVRVKLGTIFGDVRVENTSGAVEANAITGTITLEHLRGEVRAEAISGDIHLTEIMGPLSATTKSGDIHAHDLRRGGVLTGVSGDLSVTGVEGGRLEAKSVSGDVTVDNVGQTQPLDIRIESISGDLKLHDARGNFNLKTVSGDLIAERADALTFQGETVSGDVRVDLTTAFAGTLTTNTVSGDVSIAAPGASNFRFTLATQSGDLSCGHDAHDGSRTDTLWSGTVGTGAGTVTIQTRSGDVRLTREG